MSREIFLLEGKDFSISKNITFTFWFRLDYNLLFLTINLLPIYFSFHSLFQYFLLLSLNILLIFDFRMMNFFHFYYWYIFRHFCWSHWNFYILREVTLKYVNFEVLCFFIVFLFDLINLLFILSFLTCNFLLFLIKFIVLI